MNTICWKPRSTVLAPWRLHEHDLVSTCFKTLARKREREMLKTWWCWTAGTTCCLFLSLETLSFVPVAFLSFFKLWVWSHLSYSHQLEGTNGNSSRWAVSGVATFFNSNRKSKVIKRERNKDSKFFIDHQCLPSRSPNSDRGPNSKTPGLVRVCPGRPGYGSTRRVDRVLLGCCPRWFFSKPGPVQPPGRPAGPVRV
jgi:hypothetical protein